MREFRELPDHEGFEAGSQDAPTRFPGDAETAALNSGTVENLEIGTDEVDTDALSGRPDIPRQPTDSPQQEAEVADSSELDDGLAAGAYDQHVELDEPKLDESGGRPPVDLRVDSTASEDQQAFWSALARTNEHASRAATVRETSPNSGEAFDQEYAQHELHQTVRAYNDSAARGLFEAGRAALDREGFVAPTVDGSPGDPFAGEAQVQSNDGSVTVHGQALDDEMAAALLEEEPRASFTLEKPWLIDSPVLFSVTTSQEIAVARQFNGLEETDQPISLDVRNDYLVRPEDPTTAYWLRMTMDTTRNGVPDDEQFMDMTGRLMEPIVASGIPDEPEHAEPSLADSFFRSVDAIGMHSATTQLSITELQQDGDAAIDRMADQAGLMSRMNNALEVAEIPHAEARAVPEVEEVDKPAGLTADQITEASQLADALTHKEYDPEDKETVKTISDSIANCALVAARAGDWDTVDDCREHLDNMEQATLSELRAVTKVLFYQQEVGLDEDATSRLQTRLEFEKHMGEGKQPILDTVIEECGALGISPMPWIEKYAHDDADVFQRSMEYYAHEYSESGDANAGDQLTRMAVSVVEGPFSPDLIRDTAPIAVAGVDDTELRARVMDTYLDTIDGVEVDPETFGQLLNIGHVSLDTLRSSQVILEDAKLTGDLATEFRVQEELAKLRVRVARFDDAIATAYGTLNSNRQLHYDDALKQMYWGQEVQAVGIEPSPYSPNRTIDTVIQDIRTRQENDAPRDVLLYKLAAVAADAGNFDDVRKLVNAISPQRQATAYVHYWARAKTSNDLNKLDPARPNAIDPEMQAFEDSLGDRKTSLDGHYELSKALLDDPSKFEVYNADDTHLDSDDADPFEQHTVQLAKNTREVALTIANMVPRPNKPVPKPTSMHLPLLRIQFDQLTERLGAHDPEILHSQARHLIGTNEVLSARDKGLTYKLAGILASTGDTGDYGIALMAINELHERGRISDAEKAQYKLQLAKGHTETLAA